MTEPVFFDTDCFSAFLWVGKQNLVVQLYRSRVMLPQQVYDEIKKVRPLRSIVDGAIARGEIALCQLVVGTPEADLYFKLTQDPEAGYKLIGRGEAAAISLAKHRNGILASNNLRDVRLYIERYQLKYVTAGDILVEALHHGLCTEGQGNVIWRDMLAKQRKLPTETFSEYLKLKSQPGK